jgi:hypothetical protein
MMQRGSDKGTGGSERRVKLRRSLSPLHLPPPIPYFLVASLALVVSFVSFSPLFAQQSRRAEVTRLGQEFELKINQEATIEGEGLTVAFESVVQDGRCPEDVDCIWAGNAKIKVKLSKQKQTPGAVELNTGVSPKSSSYFDYEIKLVGLNPRPKSDKAVEPNEYRASLMVTKK